MNVTDSYKVKLPLLVSLNICFLFLSMFQWVVPEALKN